MALCAWATPWLTAETTASIHTVPPALRSPKAARNCAASTAAAALQLGKAIETVAKSLVPALPKPLATAESETKDLPAAPTSGKATAKAGPTLPLRDMLQRAAPPAAKAATARDAAAAVQPEQPTAKTFAGRRRPSGEAEQAAWDAMVLAYHCQKEEDQANGKLAKRALSQDKWYAEHVASVTKRRRCLKKKPPISSAHAAAAAAGAAVSEAEEVQDLEDHEEVELAEDDHGDADKDIVM